MDERMVALFIFGAVTVAMIGQAMSLMALVAATRFMTERTFAA